MNGKPTLVDRYLKNENFSLRSDEFAEGEDEFEENGDGEEGLGKRAADKDLDNEEDAKKKKDE